MNLHIFPHPKSLMSTSNFLPKLIPSAHIQGTTLNGHSVPCRGVSVYFARNRLIGQSTTIQSSQNAFRTPRDTQSTKK